jgi:hypothetical protein
MPSPADRVRRTNENVAAAETHAEVLTRRLEKLHQHAGWLSKDHVSVAVRADIDALHAAMDAGGETLFLVETLDKNIARLPGGGIRKMLRESLLEIRTVLDARTVAAAGPEAE